MNNTARICVIDTLRKHPNADRLQIATVNGFQVIVGIDTKVGDVGIFFNEGLQLSEGFAQSNSLVRVKHEDGTISGGMFEENRRVRAMNLRGVKSEGFWCPVSYLSYTSVSVPSVGTEFTSLIGSGGTVFEICNKYMTPATRKAQANKQTKAVKRVASFPEHFETEQWRYAPLPTVGSVIYLTEKLHGTSGRFGYVEVERKLSWWEKLLQRFGVAITAKEYRHFVGSRRVVFDTPEKLQGSFYGNEQFRFNAVNGIRLKEGEVLYFEIVGYVDDTKPIMGVQTVQDKDLKKIYGNSMVYAYGMPKGMCDLYVYRITQYGIELSWQQVKHRCNELGIKHVPQLDADTVKALDTKEGLDMWVSEHANGASTLDYTHIREGVCIRIENAEGVKVYKEKSYDFKVLEGIIKMQDDYVDTEEAA